MTKRGPKTGLPELVTSFAEFRRRFGDYFDPGTLFADHNFLPYAVDGFFTNGGQRVYIKRVTGKNSVTARTTASKGGLVTRLLADTTTAAPTNARLQTLRFIEVGTKLTFTQTKDGVTTAS